MIKQPLQGKVALITGASSGIGEATALALSEQGAHAVLVARRQERLDDLAGRIGQAGAQALAIVVDVRHEEEVKHAVQQAREHFGSIDVLVNTPASWPLDLSMVPIPRSGARWSIPMSLGFSI